MQWVKNAFLGLLHHLAIWRHASREESKQPSKSLPKGKELEFLPAVLEIQETPASPAGRAVNFIVIILFTLAIVWASFGEIDIVAIAQGKIVPSNHSKVIQPVEKGVISAIHVRDGQAVNKGDVLLGLDTTASRADQERLQNEAMATKVDIARLQAILANKQTLTAPSDVGPKYIKIQQQMLKDQIEEQQAKVSVAMLQVEQHKSSIELAEINMSRLEQTIPLIEERVLAVKGMLQNNFASRIDYLKLQEEHINKIQELGALTQSRVGEIAALEESKKKLEMINKEFRSKARTELAALETKEKSYQQEILKANNRAVQQTLKAPIDGVVQQLAVHTVGGVVTPAQELMVIVPKEDRLDVEAWVENKDIGFVNEGHRAEIKVESFPFTRYGTIDGEITTLSKAAVPMENIGAVYAARVSMEQSDIRVGDKQIQLSPGMNVTVEIKTGTRRLIEYFLSPLMRGFNESVRER